MTTKVTVRGVEYKSCAEAGRNLGISRQAVWESLNNGNTNTVGLKNNGNGGTAAKTTKIRGSVYKSRKDATKELGVHLSALSAFLALANKLGIDVE